MAKPCFSNPSECFTCVRTGVLAANACVCFVEVIECAIRRRRGGSQGIPPGWKRGFVPFGKGNNERATPGSCRSPELRTGRRPGGVRKDGGWKGRRGAVHVHSHRRRRTYGAADDQGHVGATVESQGRVQGRRRVAQGIRRRFPPRRVPKDGSIGLKCEDGQILLRGGHAEACSSGPEAKRRGLIRRSRSFTRVLPTRAPLASTPRRKGGHRADRRVMNPLTLSDTRLGSGLTNGGMATALTGPLPPQQSRLDVGSIPTGRTKTRLDHERAATCRHDAAGHITWHIRFRSRREGRSHTKHVISRRNLVITGTGPENRPIVPRQRNGGDVVRSV